MKWDRMINSIVYPRLRAALYLGLDLQEMLSIARAAAVEAEWAYNDSSNTKFSTWIYYRVLWAVEKALQHHHRYESAPVDLLYVRERTDPENQALVREAIGYLKAQLSSEDWTLLWLRLVEGQSYEELAEQYGKNPGAMRVRVCRAKTNAVTILALQ